MEVRRAPEAIFRGTHFASSARCRSGQAALAACQRHFDETNGTVDTARGAGHRSLHAIADELNGRGILTRRGGRWHVSTVMNLLRRLETAAG